MENIDKPMPTPTIVVGRKIYETIAVASELVMHGKRNARKVATPYAQEIGENQVIFRGAPKEIVFRQMFTMKKVTRKVRFITADNSRRYDIQVKITFKG